MRIFLTGASGYIGSAVLDALVRGGHQVTGLVRNSEKAGQVLARGATPLIGDLADPSSYQEAAVGHEGIIHAGFDGAHAVDVDRTAVETLLAAAQSRGTGAGDRVIVYTSGIWVLGPTSLPVAEDAPLNPAAIVEYRPAHEQRVVAAAGNGLRTIVVRPGIVYGGSRGIVGDLFRDASNGLVRVIGSGENHWPVVYDRDLGDLYARFAANPAASGIYHANDEGDERVNDIVEAIVTQVPGTPDVRRVPIDEAKAKHGAYALAMALDQRIRSPRAHALGWAPTLRSISGNTARLFEEWRAQEV
ncbi:MAG TPA: NAD(P)H-binding protein [Vicinamibacterales bacterium]|jgi:nucleoside-diphosphate-sugar epimerase